MLEAKAKDQGHKRKCSPKKKGLHKNFSGAVQKKNVFQKIFQALHKILTIQSGCQVSGVAKNGDTRGGVL